VAGIALVVDSLQKLFQHCFSSLSAVCDFCFRVKSDLTQALDCWLVIDDVEVAVDVDEFVQNESCI
jgi:hypothetical protein